MARKKGSKRARYAVGGYGIPNIRFTPEQQENIQRAIAGSQKRTTASTSRADAVAAKAAAKPTPTPRGIAAGPLSTAALANKQEAKNELITNNLVGGAQSARDFAPNVPGAGTAYAPPTQDKEVSILPMPKNRVPESTAGQELPKDMYTSARNAYDQYATQSTANQQQQAVQSGRAAGVVSAGTMGAEGQTDADIVKFLGLEYTGERDQDQMIQDQVEQFRQQASRVAGKQLTAEEIQKGFENYENTINMLKDPAVQEQWFGKRIHQSQLGKIVDKLGGPAGLFGLSIGLVTGGVGALGMLKAAGAGAAAGAGTAAISGDDPLRAGLAGAAGGIIGGAIGGAGGAAAGGGATGGGAAAAEAAALAQAGVPSSALGAYGTGAAAGTAGAVGGAGAALGGASAAEAAALSAAGVPASGLAAYGGAAGAGGILGTGLTAAGLAKGAAVAGGLGLAANALIPDERQQETAASTQTGIETMVDQAPDKKPVPIGLGDPTSEAYMGRPESVEAPQIDTESLEKVDVGPESTTYQMADTPDVQAAQAQAAQAQATTAGPAAQAAAPQQVGASTMEAAQAQPLAAMQAAQGQLSPEAIAAVQQGTITQPAVAAQRDTAAEEAAKAQAADFQVSEGAMVPEVTGEVAQVAAAPQAVAQQREAILGEPAARGVAAQIRLAPKTKASVDRVTADRDNIENAVDNESLDAQQILTELPEEALVSTQIDNLLQGLDTGEVPTWARPAVDAVNNMLAQRGLTASTVGRDALFNAIIQSAMPIAQSNAQALQQRASQNLAISADFLARNAQFKQEMELANLSNDQQMRLANLSALNAASADNLNAAQQTELANLQAQMETNLLQGRIAAEMNVAQLNVNQQRAVQNASMVANVDMAKFSAAQQVQLANSQFMQTMTMRDFDASQQAIMQNATAMASMDLANLDANTRLAAQNAQAFLQMDMANLQNDQQARVLNQQNAQQTMSSNQAAENAARQFNAANEQQANQFMASLAFQTEQFNKAQMNAMKQFNASEQNRIAAQNAQNATQVSLANAEMLNSVNQFNTQLEQQREQFNTANRQAIEQADVAWRRQANTINTAAINAANQQNVMNQFNMTMFEQQQLWQQLRDEADYVRQSYENDETRKTQLYATAIGNESGASNQSSSSTATLINAITKILTG